eukprot:83179-Chlamydomonas_euryale.AAC.1
MVAAEAGGEIGRAPLHTQTSSERSSVPTEPFPTSAAAASSAACMHCGRDLLGRPLPRTCPGVNAGGGGDGGSGRGTAVGSSMGCGARACGCPLACSLRTLCLSGVDHASVAALVRAAPGLRALHVARPQHAGGVGHMAWAAALPRLPRLRNLTVEAMWQLDDAAFDCWAGCPWAGGPEAGGSCSCCCCGGGIQGCVAAEELGGSDSNGRCDAIASGVSGCSCSCCCSGGARPLACRLERFGLLVSGCSADGGVRRFAQACTSLTGLQLGLLAYQQS